MAAAACASLPGMIVCWGRRGCGAVLTLLLALTCLPAAGFDIAGAAQQPAGDLQQRAIDVMAPARAILISIARAGDRLVAVGAHGVIICSDDNGKTWKQAAVPTSETITSVGFATPQTGWAAGAQGVILHTSDGGETWQLQLTGGQVLNLMTAAADQATAAAPTDEVAQKAVRRAGIFSQDGPDKPFLSVLAMNAQTAIIFGAYRMTVMTKDGGKSWVDWSLHIGDPVSHNIYGATLAGSSIYVAEELGFLLRSDDGGSSFNLVTSPDPSTFFGILGTKQNSILAFGVAGEVFRSVNRGQTWSQSAISANADLTAGLVLQSGHILVVSEDGTIYESADDGLSFHALTLNEGMALYGLAQASNGDVVLVGSGGVRVVQTGLFE
jgi:photosystem II stability/assembly factor-like uncharacterized protein